MIHKNVYIVVKGWARVSRFDKDSAEWNDVVFAVEEDAKNYIFACVPDDATIHITNDDFTCVAFSYYGSTELNWYSIQEFELYESLFDV